MLSSSPHPSRQILWNSVSRLMIKTYGKINRQRLAVSAAIGIATVKRIEAMDTSVGLDVIDAIAGHFKVEAWQLLVPDFDPAYPPELAVMTDRERDLYARIRDAAVMLAAEPAPAPYTTKK